MAKIYFDIEGRTIEISSHGWFKLYKDTTCEELVYRGEVEELGLDYSKRIDGIGYVRGFEEVTLEGTKGLAEGFIKSFGQSGKGSQRR